MVFEKYLRKDISLKSFFGYSTLFQNYCEPKFKDFFSVVGNSIKI